MWFNANHWHHPWLGMVTIPPILYNLWSNYGVRFMISFYQQKGNSSNIIKHHRTKLVMFQNPTLSQTSKAAASHDLTDSGVPLGSPGVPWPVVAGQTAGADRSPNTFEDLLDGAPSWIQVQRAVRKRHHFTWTSRDFGVRKVSRNLNHGNVHFNHRPSPPHKSSIIIVARSRLHTFQPEEAANSWAKS